MTTKTEKLPKLAHAVLILPGGQILEANPSNGKKFTLEEVQKSVGFKSGLSGSVYVTPIRLPARNLMLVDEDGTAKGLAYNAEASLLAGQPIVGNAFVVPPGKF